MTRHACETAQQIDVAVEVICGIDCDKLYEIQGIEIGFGKILPFMPGARPIPEIPTEPARNWYYELLEIIGEAASQHHVIHVLSFHIDRYPELTAPVLSVDGAMRFRAFDNLMFKDLLPTDEHYKIVDFKRTADFINYLGSSKAFKNQLFDMMHRFCFNYLRTSIPELQIGARVIDGKPWTVYVHDRRDWPVIDLERALTMSVEDLRYELFMFERKVLMNKRR